MSGSKFVRALLVLLILLSVIGCFISCRKEEEAVPQAVYYTVTFDTKGGEEIPSKTILEGAKIPDPGAPVREGYVFNGWMHNGAKWNFDSRTVKEDMTLEAQWFSADVVFAYEINEETQTATVTKLKEKLENVEVPSVIGGFPVTAIGDGVFSGLYSSKVHSIRVASSVTTVGEGAFADLEGIEILFDDGCALTSIGSEAFANCTGLKSVPLGEGLREIAPWSFSGCTALKEISIHKTVTVIRVNAFGGCAALQDVILHEGVSTVEDGAFEDCDALRTVYYYGSAEQIDALLDQNTARMNDALQEATIYLYAQAKPSAEGAYGSWYWDENGKIRLW